MRTICSNSPKPRASRKSKRTSSRSSPTRAFRRAPSRSPPSATARAGWPRLTATSKTTWPPAPSRTCRRSLISTATPTGPRPPRSAWRNSNSEPRIFANKKIIREDSRDSRFQKFFAVWRLDYLLDRFRAFHADQFLIQAAEEIRQMVRVEAELIQNRCVQILDVEAVLDGRCAELVGGADTRAALDAAAGQPHREAIG